MCGIVGIAARSGSIARAWLTAGRDAMSHRGPDDCGEWWSPDGRVGLGHRRLAIVDLSPGGHQPMHDPSGPATIVFNGEIYNWKELREELTGLGHMFRSQSDTEVLLAAYRQWGSDFLARLNGMFALALYDRKRQVLLLARDRAGEKPLFYALTNNELRFASELKGLFAEPSLPRRIAPESLDCFLAIGFVPRERCIVDGVAKLPPAHALEFDLSTGRVRRWAYWQLPLPVSDASIREADLVDALEALLDDAVRLQLVADVPVGVLLSGGVDSSLVTAAAARTSTRVRTFTVTMPQFQSHDESAHARLIASHFGTEHLELQVDAASDELSALLPMLARQCDEPMIDSSLIPTYLVSRLIREHCTVALGGDGADELFGGYMTYNRLLWIHEKLGPIPAFLRRSVGFAASRFLPTGAYGRNWLRVLGQDLRTAVPHASWFFDREERRDLIGSLPAREAERIYDDAGPQDVGLLERASRMDFNHYLPEDILVKVDRASMRNSLETRSPFLDYRIIELAYGRVPAHLKATSTARKILLKKLTERRLPATFDRQRKQGFSIPLNQWLRTPAWLDVVRSVLLDDGCLFRRSAIERLLDGQARGRANAERIFGLTMFELWRREYAVTL